MGYQSNFKGQEVDDLLTYVNEQKKIVLNLKISSSIDYDNFGSIIKNLSSLSLAYEITKL